MGNTVASLFGGGQKDDGGAQAMMDQIAEQKKEADRLRAQNEEERRAEAERLAARRSSRLRGGSRMLLSEARLTPVTGLQQTLGSGEIQS
jgi:hypothetical protein